MSIELHYPATDSGSHTKPSIQVDALDWASDWAQVSNGTSGNSVLTENTTAGLDTPQSLMVSRKQMTNVYANTSVDKALWAPTTKGFRLTFSLKDSPYLTDTDEATFKQVLPIQVELRITYPISSQVTADVLQREITRLIAGLYETGSTTMEGRLSRAMRGALAPSDL